MATRKDSRYKWTPKQRQQMVEAYQRGDTYPDIMARFGISKAGLIYLLRSEGVELKRLKGAVAPSEIESQLAELIASNKRIERLLKELIDHQRKY